MTASPYRRGRTDGRRRLSRARPGNQGAVSELVTSPPKAHGLQSVGLRAPHLLPSLVMRPIEERAMTATDTSVTKVNAAFSPHVDMGQKYLASGTHVVMGLWDNEPPGEAKPETRRDYETVGYVISGRAELRLEGQLLLLER